MQIGQVAAIAGVSTRAVRHYHAAGVLPEPARRGNAYREYDSRDLLTLLRVVRLTALGLSLAEVRDALGDPSGSELKDILAAVAADLQHQQEQLAARRERIAAALVADDHLALSPVVADLLARVRGAVADPGLVRSEQEALELLEAGMAPAEFAELAGAYRNMLDDPAAVAAAGAAQYQFDALTDQAPDHPDVLAVAAQLREIGTGMFPTRVRTADAGADEPGGEDAAEDDGAWRLFLDSLTPAQQHAMQHAGRQWGQL